MAECEVSMAYEVNEFEHNNSLCISFNEEVNREKCENSVLNIQDEKQVLHPIVQRPTTRTWVDVVKKSCVHVKAKVKDNKLDISIIPHHESASSSEGVEKASEPSALALITVPTFPSFIKRRIHEHAVDEVTSAQNLVELTQKTPNESVSSISKSIKKVKSHKVVNEAAIHVHVNAFDALTSDEVHEERVESREEIESMRREKVEGKLKSRKKGKLQLLRTQEAEEREKEREKRVRKKGRKKAEKSIPPPTNLQRWMWVGITTTFIIILLLRIILS